MSSIKDGDIKLSIPQICDKLAQTIPASTANQILAHAASQDINSDSCVSILAHAILDSYKYLPSETDADMEIKRMLKHLMEKYMKSTAVDTPDNKAAYSILMRTITEKGQVS